MNIFVSAFIIGSVIVTAGIAYKLYVDNEESDRICRERIENLKDKPPKYIDDKIIQTRFLPESRLE